jgi:putative transposase
MQINAFIDAAYAIRKRHGGCGVSKLYEKLSPSWVGRINGIKLLMEYGFRLKKKRNYLRTTYSVSSEYVNLIEGMLVTNKNQVWQSDITCYKVKGIVYYIVFIIDIYTKRILSYSIGNHMRAEANLRALKKAIACQRSSCLKGLIHHSDRGSQYVDHDYTLLLKSSGIWISMGNMPQENAYVERLNGIIKNEFLRKWTIETFAQLKRKLKEAVDYYNNERTHSCLPRRTTPIQFEQRIVNLDYQNRPKVIVYTDGNRKLKAISNRLEFLPEAGPQAPVCPMVYF